MMAGVNKVILVGNLGAEPDVRTTPAGQMVATVSLATSETFNDREGKRQERTEWHRVVLWGKLAELAQRWLKKGSQIYVEGRLQTRSWEDQQTGQKRYATEVVGASMTFLGRAEGGGRQQDGSSGGRQQEQQRAPAASGPNVGDEGFFDEDVPF